MYWSIHLMYSLCGVDLAHMRYTVLSQP